MHFLIQRVVNQKGFFKFIFTSDHFEVGVLIGETLYQVEGNCESMLIVVMGFRETFVN